MQTSELKPTQKLVLSRVCRMCCCSGCLNATDIFEQTARQLQWRKVKVMHRRPYSTVTFDEKIFQQLLDCWTFSQGLPNVAKVALPLVRQGELNPEDEDLFCTSLFRNQSAHK